MACAFTCLIGQQELFPLNIKNVVMYSALTLSQHYFLYLYKFACIYKGTKECLHTNKNNFYNDFRKNPLDIDKLKKIYIF